MIINFSAIDTHEQPVLVLENIDGTELQTLGYAFNLNCEFKFNETSTISFDIPAYVDGEKTPHYDDIVGMRIIDMVGYGLFMLVNPSINNNGTKEIKSCKAYSIEYELTFKKITLEESTYNFWDPVAPQNTVLGIIANSAKSWSIGTVSTSLLGKYRTFNVSGDNCYNFMKSTLQEKYRCIFDFDTYARKINVIAVDDIIATQPVFMSLDNLANSINIDEDTESVVTCLDVNGADGVDIRSANPLGTNKIYNLDYLIASGHVSQNIASKWAQWKSTFNANKDAFYATAVEQSVHSSSEIAIGAKIERLNGELSGLEALKSTYVEAIAQGLTQDGSGSYFSSLITQVDADIASKQLEIDTATAQMNSAKDSAESLLTSLSSIASSCSFENFFTDYVCPKCGCTAIKCVDDGVTTYECQSCGCVSDNAESELTVLDRCFKEDSISDASFVANEVSSYINDDVSSAFSSGNVSIDGATITGVTYNASKRLYNISGGHITTSGSKTSSANIISAAIVWDTSNNSCIVTSYLSSGSIGDSTFASGNLTINGTTSSITDNLITDPEIDGYMTGSSLSFSMTSGSIYYTSNVSEFQSMAVAKDLYEYGMSCLAKLSSPSFKFSVDSGNFLSIEEFFAFKDNLRLGRKIYLDIDNRVLEPVCIGVAIDFEDTEKMQLTFADTFTSTGSAGDLADLLTESISMGKSVSKSSNGWSAFLDSGASTEVKKYMDGALDVSKQSIMSSQNQGISWDESGLRFRKFTDGVADDEQIWAINNSICFTDDGWQTVKMAIGKSGDDWGVVAPSLVGKAIAGETFTIESSATDTSGNKVFKIDSSGVSMFNADMTINKGVTTITLSPEDGICIKKGTEKKFYVDTDGNLKFSGNLEAASGTFSGELLAATGTFSGALSAATGTFSGALSAATGTFSGELSAATGTFAGDISAATGNFSGNINGATGTFSGDVYCNNIITSGGSTVFNGSDIKADVSSMSWDYGEIGSYTGGDTHVSSYGMCMYSSGSTVAVTNLGAAIKGNGGSQIWVTNVFGGTDDYTGGSGSSDIREKHDISYDLEEWYEIYKELRPASYVYNNKPASGYSIGFIAQDVKATLEAHGKSIDDAYGLIYDNAEDRYYLLKTEFVALNTYAIQKLSARIDDLEKQITEKES